MVLHQKDRARQAKGVDGRHQEPLLNLSRRRFIAGAGALVIGLTLRGGAATADSTAGGLRTVAGGDATPSLWIAIEPDGTVRITCHRSEMGQQVWTSMAQLVADELEADWDRVTIVQAEGHPRYGDQNTDGSRSVRYNFTRLRYAGAAMRHMLEAAAAQHWGVAAEQCRGVQHAVVHEASGRRIGYGEIASAAAALSVPSQEAVTLKDRSTWRLIGKAVPSLTVPQILRGEGTFGIDVQLPEMLHAVIARPPQVFGSVNTVDDRATLQVPGVVRTVRLDSPQAPAAFKALGGVAVIARDTWSAIRGREALKVTWNPGPHADYESATFAQTLLHTANQPGAVRRNRGDVAAAFAQAAQRLSADYYVPHLAHSPIEPPAATARWDGGTVECWGCVQDPQAARRAVAQACGVDEEAVTIHVTWLGGGFGRKSKPDFVVEAALVAREVGQPVKVTWTREDELRHGYYHTVSAQHLEGALDANGRCTAFLHRTVFPPIPSTFRAGLETPSWGELRLGASDNPFAVPHLRLETGNAPAKLRIGWLRSVANIYHAFAIQSFAAELAAAAGRDPKDYLLDLIGPPRLIDPRDEGVEEYDNYGSPLAEYPIDTGRMRQVIDIVATMAGWGRTVAQRPRPGDCHASVVCHLCRDGRRSRGQSGRHAGHPGGVVGDRRRHGGQPATRGGASGRRHALRALQRPVRGDHRQAGGCRPRELSRLARDADPRSPA